MGWGGLTGWAKSDGTDAPQSATLEDGTVVFQPDRVAAGALKQWEGAGGPRTLRGGGTSPPIPSGSRGLVLVVPPLGQWYDSHTMTILFGI